MLAPPKSKQNLASSESKRVEDIIDVNVMLDDHRVKLKFRYTSKRRITSNHLSSLHVIQIFKIRLNLNQSHLDHISCVFEHSSHFCYLLDKISFWNLNPLALEQITYISNLLSDRFSILKENKEHGLIFFLSVHQLEGS